MLAADAIGKMAEMLGGKPYHIPSCHMPPSAVHSIAWYGWLTGLSDACLGEAPVFIDSIHHGRKHILTVPHTVIEIEDHPLYGTIVYNPVHHHTCLLVLVSRSEDHLQGPERGRNYLVCTVRRHRQSDSHFRTVLGEIVPEPVGPEECRHIGCCSPLLPELSGSGSPAPQRQLGPGGNGGQTLSVFRALGASGSQCGDHDPGNGIQLPGRRPPGCAGSLSEGTVRRRIWLKMFWKSSI